MRKVTIFKCVYQGAKCTLEPDYDGTFHGWGVDYEEFENGPGGFTAAIVEKQDGTVELVRTTHMKFKRLPPFEAAP